MVAPRSTLAGSAAVLTPRRVAAVPAPAPPPSWACNTAKAAKKKNDRDRSEYPSHQRGPTLRTAPSRQTASAAGWSCPCSKCVPNWALPSAVLGFAKFADVHHVVDLVAQLQPGVATEGDVLEQREVEPALRGTPADGGRRVAERELRLRLERRGIEPPLHGPLALGKNRIAHHVRPIAAARVRALGRIRHAPRTARLPEGGDVHLPAGDERPRRPSGFGRTAARS